MKNIAAALVNAKKAFRPAIKSCTNPHFRNKYADLGSCIDAVDDALLENGIFMYQMTAEDETGVTVETVFLHSSGEELRSGQLHFPSSKQDAQGYMGTLTYARRGSLMAACGIAPEDDDGNTASQPHGNGYKQISQPPAVAEPISKPPSCTAKQIDLIRKLYRSSQITEEERARIDGRLFDGTGNGSKIIEWLNTEIASRKEIEAAEMLREEGMLK